MNFFNFWKKTETRDISPPVDDVLLKTLLKSDYICENKAMNIPAVASSINIICETVSQIPIKLFKEELVDGHMKTIEIANDNRPNLLNFDTKDTLDGVQFKRALARDYLLHGGAYAYINASMSKINSINYVPFDNLSMVTNFDIVFKDYDIYVQGKRYKPFEFLKILKSTKNGSTGKGILSENAELLSTAYTTMQYERTLVATGGNKKGYITTSSRLGQKEIDILKTAWRNLYSNNEDNVVILNDGLNFKEASNTSVEMQLNEKKKSMSDDIKTIFGIPPDFKFDVFIKTAIMPILSAIECALNRDFLFEREKNKLYFAFDLKEIAKGDIKSRFEAYKLALESNLMQIDECRYMEDLEPLGLNFIKLGLQDVLYNPKTKEVFTPNTGKTTNIGEEISENQEKEMIINGN